MPTWTRNAALFAALVFAAFVNLGCGHGGSTGPVLADDDYELVQLFEIYSATSKKLQKPPTQTSDIDRKQWEVQSPAVMQKLRNGEFIVVWGTPVGGNSILAYGKGASQNGGPVLLANGKIKQLSADEIQAATKPKG